MARLLIAIANRGLKNPTALLQPCGHFLDDLPAILFAFKLALRREQRLHELVFRRVIEAEIQTFTDRTPRSHYPAQMEMEFRVACIALEIIEYDDVIFARLRVHKGKQGNHARTLHKISTAANIVWENSVDDITARRRILAAAMLLAFQSASFRRLLLCGDTAID
ncbi:MAG TPA: hypothetical protein VGO22_22940 [Pseudorhizobium sp.]|nr:hypothetical protein [Pseudorhizobium sp.]